MITQHFNSRPHGGRQGNTSVFHAGRHFNSRPHGGRRSSKLPHTGQKSFQLTPSRRATGRNAESGGSCNNFNSRPHGGRPMHRPSCQSHRNFNSRPHGGRLDGTSERGLNRRFQLTPSRRATRCTVHLVNLIEISTHALTEGDQFTTALRLSFFISTHALTEGDILPACILIQNCIFQLTPSRRATLCCSIGIYGATFQLTPSRRATDYIAELFAEFHISTHALTEGD